MTGPNPVNRGKPGSKVHVVCDRAGLPLAVMVTAANVHDSQLLLPMLYSVPAIHAQPDTAGGGGTPRRPTTARDLRAEVRRRGIAARIARKGAESSTRLARHRWIVESCMSWLMRYRRLVRRYDRKGNHYEAFVTGPSPITYGRRGGGAAARWAG
ncbi:transposase [Micromonospora chersina]|uniref:transposase n=1 Tax=Micromonospora chersina TaxID=47854 RepID=UPI003451CBBC